MSEIKIGDKIELETIVRKINDTGDKVSITLVYRGEPFDVWIDVPNKSKTHTFTF